MSADWTALLEQCPWLDVDDARVGEPTAWTRPVPAWAPDWERLLRAARVTPVVFRGAPFEVLGWDGADGAYGWLCPAPPDVVPDALHPDHRELLAVLGGVVEQFGERDSWTYGHEATLTVALAVDGPDPRELVDAYDWMWTDDGLPVPDVSGYYGVSAEGNGNLTMCHRERGDVLLFAPDHDLDDITPLDGSPEPSLYTIDGCPDLRAWLAVVAQQWQPQP